MSEVEAIRDVAVDHHDKMASHFVQNYTNLSRDRFSSAFTYGRSKLDREIEALITSLPAGSRFLDVGCGTGDQLRMAADHGLQPLGVEPAPAMLAHARQNVPTAILEDGVATKLPFDDASVDAVIMIEVLRYLHPADIATALSEASRVLKPGGKLLVTLVNRWALDGFYLRQRSRQRQRGIAFDSKNPYCQFHDPAEARRLLLAAGFGRAETIGRMIAPLRLAYKANRGLGAFLARKLERLDDRINRRGWTTRFAGHLIAIGWKA